MNGVLVVSLDFEMYWGMRDIVPAGIYRARAPQLRKAVPCLLDMFREHGVHATWATVGMLFFRTRAELMEHLPARLPAYADGRYDPYRGLDEVGEDEAADPMHFAPSLIEAIRGTPHQEIATHTFSHYYCLEEGQTAEDFRADVAAAQGAARRAGLELGAIIFPRNQYSPEYLQVCAEQGIGVYRGTGSHWLYRGRARGDERQLRRALRLLDAYLNLSGDNTRALDDIRGDPCEVAASRFLRPWLRPLAAFEGLRRRRIEGEMTAAARRGRMYHLWLHPEDFGGNLERNREFLSAILRHFDRLHSEYGMITLNMAEAASRFGRPLKTRTLIGAGN